MSRPQARRVDNMSGTKDKLIAALEEVVLNLRRENKALHEQLFLRAQGTQAIVQKFAATVQTWFESGASAAGTDPVPFVSKENSELADRNGFADVIFDTVAGGGYDLRVTKVPVVKPVLYSQIHPQFAEGFKQEVMDDDGGYPRETDDAGSVDPDLSAD